MHKMSLLKTKKMVVHLSKSVHFLLNGRKFTIHVLARFNMMEKLMIVTRHEAKMQKSAISGHSGL